MTDDLRVEQVDDLKVADLRKELSHRRLSCTGRKSELQQRLKEYLSEDYVEDEADKEQSEGAEETEETIAQTRRRRTSSTGSRSVSPKPGSDIERPGSPYTRSMARRDRENSLSPKPPSRGNTPPPTPRSATSSDAVAPRSARATRRSPKPDQSPPPPTPASSGKETPASPAPTRGRRRSRTNEGAEPVSPKAEEQPTTTQPQAQPKAAQSPKPVASPTPAPAGKPSPKPVETKSPKPSKGPAVLETLLMDAEEDILADELTEVQTAEAPAEPAKKAAPAPAPARAPAPAPKPSPKPAPAARSPQPAPAPAPARLPAALQPSTTEEAEFQRVRDPHPAKCARSVTVRIDGLKRPFPLPKFKAALEAMSGVKVVDSENFFISMKRTHCYLTMDTVEQAEAFRNHICGMKYHDGLLSAEFSDLTAVEASTLSEEERDLRMKVMASRGGKAAAAAPASKAAPQKQQQQQQQETQPTAAAKATAGTVPAPEARRKLISIEHAAANSIFRGAIGSLKRQASSSSMEDDNAAKAATKRNKPMQENGAGKRARPDSAEEHEEKQAEEGEAAKRMRDAKPAEPEAPIATLDDLFRKTTAKPALYWLPVSEEEVQRRREAIARFQAQSSATTGTA